MMVFGELYNRCEEKRMGVGISETGLHVYRSAEMRYVGQSYELEVPFPEGKGEITKEIVQEIVRRFHDVHQSIYEHSAPDSPVEFIAFRTVFSQKSQAMPHLPRIRHGESVAPKGWRKAYFDEYKKFIDTPLYERSKLVREQKINGPAIVEQVDTTTVIYPKQSAEVDAWGNIVISMVGK